MRYARGKSTQRGEFFHLHQFGLGFAQPAERIVEKARAFLCPPLGNPSFQDAPVGTAPIMNAPLIG